MRRRLRLPRGLALALALLAGPAAASPSTLRDAHRHPGQLFEIRFEPVMGTYFIYRAFLADPDAPGSLMVERGNGYSGDEDQTDLIPATCPALRRQVAALAALPMPSVELGEGGPYEAGIPRGEGYEFSGFVRFANGGEGEISFTGTYLPGRPSDPRLDWLRGLVRAFDACRPRAG